MSLKYTSISAVQVTKKEGFRIATVNQVIRRLVENDMSFFGTSVQPGIWERRWYNDRGNKSLYYKKGDAVWINTEQAEEFILAHVADIDMYIQGNPAARYEFMSLSAAEDASGMYRLRRDIALGLNDFKSAGEIYYLGNLVDEVQIRVSLSDDNDRPPTDNAYWKDFFDKSYNEAFYTNQILSSADEQLSAVYGKHLSEYHLTGVQEPGEFYKRYLQSNLSNISKMQKFVNHSWYQKDMTGFDHAILFISVNRANNEKQWFRLWKSGMLEHGGVVDITRNTCGTNNTSSRLYTVNLKWTYDGKTAPVYNFPAVGIGGFYSQDGQIYTGSGTVDYSPAINALGSQKRYIVDISPLQSVTSTAVAGGPYPAVVCDRFTRYPGKEVTSMNNDSFTFLYAPNQKIKFYSYYVKGFTVNQTRAR